MRRHRRFSDGNFAPVAPTIGESPPRFEPAEGVTAGELEEILHKKELTPREVMVIRQSMVQVWDAIQLQQKADTLVFETRLRLSLIAVSFSQMSQWSVGLLPTLCSIVVDDMFEGRQGLCPLEM